MILKRKLWSVFVIQNPESPLCVIIGYELALSHHNRGLRIVRISGDCCDEAKK